MCLRVTAAIYTMKNSAGLISGWHGKALMPGVGNRRAV